MITEANNPADSDEDVPKLPSQIKTGIEMDDAQLDCRTRTELYNQVVNRSRKSLPRADRILLLLQEEHEFQVKASYGSTACFVVKEESISRAIIRRVRRTSRAFLLSDALSDREFKERQSVKEIGQRSVLCTPIRIDNNNVGVLYADSVSLVNAFTEEELKWTVRLATSIGRILRTLPPETKPEETRAFQPKADSERAQLSGLKLQSSGSLDQLPAFSRFPKPSLSDKATFFRSLATLLTSGVTIYSAVALLAEAESRLSPFCSQLADDVAQGHPLSRAMTRFPGVFNASEVQLLAIGEESGTLDLVTETLARSIDRDWKLAAKVKSALVYPAIIAAFCLLGCVIAPPLFLNDFFETLTNSSQTLPYITVVVMAVSKWLCHPITITLIGTGIYFCRKWFLRRKAQVEKFLYLVPAVNEFYRDLVVLKFCRALAVQLEAGLYLDKSLLAAAKASASLRLQEEILVAIEKLLAGESLAFALERTTTLPPTAVEFLRVGEETGKVGEMCRSVESLLAVKTEESLETAQGLIEPLAMALVGVLVGIVSIACLLPLVRMISDFA